MTICLRRVVSVAFTGVPVVRRKRVIDDGLNLPAELLPAAALRDPEGWREVRFAWARQHDWGPKRLGFLAFFDETVYVYRTALGLTPPIGCVERYEARPR